ncbi:MAG TPA: alcohol dehydrogenase catalytic domain-containing protein [Candidatus Dormibacteraeota bacterium]|nr:alcohol dehydrogenase catalytic domain-containing protein [Candidatus Dormibacteraeota bacterium]
MQAVVKSRPGPGAGWATVPERPPGPGEAQLQLVVASICGTDLHILKWNSWAAGRVHPPRILGHEMAGRVVALGEGVESPRLGDLVGVESHLVDLDCPQCRRGDYHVCERTRILGVDVDGVFAERVIVPARNCRVAPSGLDPAVVAFQEPMGNAVHACAQGELKDQVVLVTGCGPIGCAAVGIARAEGARLVVAVDRVPARLRIAERMGADALVDTATAPDLEASLRRACQGEADVVLEMSGHPMLIRGALATVRPGGWVSLLGLGDGELSLDLSSQVVMRGITLFGVTGRRQFETWDQTSRLLSSGRVDVGPILTHRVALSDFEHAADLAGSGEVGKVVLYPPEGDWR